MYRLVQYAVLSMLALMSTAVFCSPLHTGEHVSLTRRDLDGDIRRWSETIKPIRAALDLPGVVQALSTLEGVFTEMEQSPDNKEHRLQQWFNEWQEVYGRFVSRLCGLLGVEDEVINLDQVHSYLHDPYYVDPRMLFRANLMVPLWYALPDSDISDSTLEAYNRLVKNSMCVIYAFTRVEPKRNIHLFRASPQVVENAFSVLNTLLPPSFKLNAETECANTPLAKKWVPLSEQGSPQQQPQQSQPLQGPQPKPQKPQQSQQTQEPEPEKNQKQTFFQWLASIRPIKWLVDFVKRFLPSISDKNSGHSTK